MLVKMSLLVKSMFVHDIYKPTLVGDRELVYKFIKQYTTITFPGKTIDEYNIRICNLGEFVLFHGFDVPHELSVYSNNDICVDTNITRINTAELYPYVDLYISLRKAKDEMVQRILSANNISESQYKLLIDNNLGHLLTK